LFEKDSLMNIVEVATSRRTCKVFDPGHKLPEDSLAALRTVLRFTPSSVNSQPWHFLIAASDTSKEKIAATLDGAYAYNAPKVRNASHVLVMCARTDLDDTYLDRVLAQEEADGRFQAPEGKAMQNKTRHFFVGLHRQKQTIDVWIEHQVYIALGTVLQAAGALAIDACPMEGIDTQAIDVALGLSEKGLRCVVLVALGYHGTDDFNAKLPKSRLPETAVFSEL
jgi:nitroreductase/dihydropteridine reductase